MNLLEEVEFREKWTGIEVMFLERFGKKPDMEAILYLIGINELGDLPQKEFTKEQKQDLMHVAVCAMLQSSGFFVFEYKDDDGWPHFKQIKHIPPMEAIQQENFLKDHILLYFMDKI